MGERNSLHPPPAMMIQDYGRRDAPVNTMSPRVIVAGEPGSGKTSVLLHKGTEWLLGGNDVNVVSTRRWSRTPCTMLYNQLQQVRATQPTGAVALGELHFWQFDFAHETDVEKAVKDLSEEGRGGSLYVIADEVYGCVSLMYVTDKTSGSSVTSYSKSVMFIRLHLWAAASDREDPPSGWLSVRPGNSVTRKIPKVTQLYHRGPGHSGGADNCESCGREVARYLHSLRATGKVAVPDTLEWRDMLVLTGFDIDENTGVIRGLKEAGIPVNVMRNDNIDDVVTCRSDVVWVTDRDRVRGLQRKVVVYLQVVGARDNRHGDTLFMSHCTSRFVKVVS